MRLQLPQYLQALLARRLNLILMEVKTSKMERPHPIPSIQVSSVYGLEPGGPRPFEIKFKVLLIL